MTRSVLCVDRDNQLHDSSECKGAQPSATTSCELGLCECSESHDCIMGALSGDGNPHFDCIGGRCVCLPGYGGCDLTACMHHLSMSAKSARLALQVLVGRRGIRLRRPMPGLLRIDILM
jgi:hypothetical protein